MIIEGIIASTEIDSHNEQLTLRQLEKIEKAINSDFALAATVQHNPLIPPVGKVTQASVKEIKKGTYGLVTESEIFEHESTITLADGTELIKQESENDKRPFRLDFRPPDQTILLFDKMDFKEKSDIGSFLTAIKPLSKIHNFNYDRLVRKAIDPSPQLDFIVNTALVSLLFVAAKKTVEIVSERVTNKLMDDISSFLKFMKSTAEKYVASIAAGKRQITYVVQLRSDPIVELVANTDNVELLINALNFIKLNSIIKNAYTLQSELDGAKVQYTLNQNGEWELNFLLTKHGAVIGRPSSIKSEARKISAILELGGLSLGGTANFDNDWTK